MLYIYLCRAYAEEIIMNGLSKADDLASGERYMSHHFAKQKWKRHNISSATATQDLHAAGVAICSHGESSVSGGLVYEFDNGAFARYFCNSGQQLQHFYSEIGSEYQS